MIKKMNVKPPQKILYHNYLFLFGFIYYLITPLIIVRKGYLSEYSGMSLLYDYNLERFTYHYLFCIAIIFISFYFGSWIVSKKYKFKTYREKEYCLEKRQIKIILFPVVLICFITAIAHRENLFTGYIGEADTILNGTLATGQLLFVFWLIYELLIYKSSDILLTLSVIICSVLLLGVGSRMYVLIPVVSTFLYCIEYNLFPIRKIICVGATCIAIFVSIGLLRSGASITVDGLLFIGFAEPCFTWISALSLFQYNDLSFFYFPDNFLTSFYNYIPSQLFPNKAEYIQNISLSYDTPLGATNIVVSLISNFGIVGSGLFSALVGGSLSYIRKRKSDFFWETYYLCICGAIPFQVFRDDLSIASKVVIMNFLIYPTIFRYLAKLFVHKYHN